MYLNPSDREVVAQLSFDQRVSIQSAAYTAYIELTPNNRKPISQREFHERFKDNWGLFAEIENQEGDPN